jgi:hypothetical protein
MGSTGTGAPESRPASAGGALDGGRQTVRRTPRVHALALAADRVTRCGKPVTDHAATTHTEAVTCRACLRLPQIHASFTLDADDPDTLVARGRRAGRHLIADCHQREDGPCRLRCSCGARLHADSPDALATSFARHAGRLHDLNATARSLRVTFAPGEML